MTLLKLRETFPGENPQQIRCPHCGDPNTMTSEDGVIYICPKRHFGYYEQPAGVVIPEERWRPQ